MDALLISVTVISLLMAASMALIVVKLLADERRRSDARVAALSELATSDRPPLAADARQRFVADALAGSPFPSEDLDLRPEPAGRTMSTSLSGDLFADREHDSPWRSRLAVMAALAVVVAAAGWLAFGGAFHPAAAAAPAQAAAVTVPLELLSLAHDQQADRIVIKGLVENPRGAATLTRVVATAFAFGPDGTFLNSARAPLDFTSLRGGDESPFVVAVPVSGPVGRYRVGFRTEDGAIIAHVDKRSETLALK